MATRTRYRRTRTGVAFGGAFWRFDPASQTPGGGGAGGPGANPWEPPLPRTPPPADPLGTRSSVPEGSPAAGAIAMGGSVSGRAADGSYIIFINGRNYFFDAQGQPLTAANATAAAAPPPGTAAPAGSTASAPSSRVGTTVNGRTATGGAVTGTITGMDANGNLIVQWQDGTVSNYDSTGKLVSTTPPPGTQPPTTTPPTTTPPTTQPPTTTPPTTTPPVAQVQPPTTAPPTANPLPQPAPQPVAAAPTTFTGAPATGTPTGDTSVLTPGPTDGYQIDPTSMQLFFPPTAQTPTVQGTDAFVDPGTVDAVPTTTAPVSPYAPPPIPIGTGSAFDPGFTAPPSTLDVAATLAPPDLAAPMYPAFANPSPIEAAPQPGLTDYVPPDQYAPPTGAYLTA